MSSTIKTGQVVTIVHRHYGGAEDCPELLREKIDAVFATYDSAISYMIDEALKHPFEKMTNETDEHVISNKSELIDLIVDEEAIHWDLDNHPYYDQEGLTISSEEVLIYKEEI